MEARAGIEPTYEDLQSSASPLCHLAQKPKDPDPVSLRIEAQQNQFGAGNEIRTRDLNLGKVALYQLSYSRAYFLDSSALF